MNPSDILKNSYEKIITGELNLQVETYYTIIQIKKENILLIDFEQSLYKDLKEFIKLYIISVEKKDYGYDFIDINKLIDAIDIINSASLKFELYSFTIRHLKSNNQDEYINGLYKKRLLSKFELILNKKSIFKYFEATLLITSYNLFTIFFSLFLLSLFALLIFQDAQFECFTLFKFQLENFCSIEIVNQFLNIISKPIGLAENFKIIPINVWGVLILICFKFLYLSVVVNFMFEKIKDNLIR